MVGSEVKMKKGGEKRGGGDGRTKSDAAPRTSHRRLIRATYIEASK
jgi:hypothetical protein